MLIASHDPISLSDNGWSCLFCFHHALWQLWGRTCNVLIIIFFGSKCNIREQLLIQRSLSVLLNGTLFLFSNNSVSQANSFGLHWLKPSLIVHRPNHMFAYRYQLSSHSIFLNTAQKMKFPADLVTFTEEILNGKLHFLCSEI